MQKETKILEQTYHHLGTSREDIAMKKFETERHPINSQIL